MKSLVAFAIVSLPFLSLVSAQGTVHLSITRKHQPATFGKFRKRDSNGVEVAARESDDMMTYYAKASVGTPPQDMEFQLDTGSSDIWMIASNAITNNAQPPAGVTPGSFDESKSSTYNLTGEGQFGIEYADHSKSTGDVFLDTFTFGTAAVGAMQMGLARNTSTVPGLIGLGFALNEAAVDRGNPQYPNLVESMVNQGVIPTKAFSLWLNDLDTKDGSLLFGGIDTAKYDGALTNLALYPSADGRQREYLVSWTSLSVTSESGVSNITASDFPATAALLDSGASMARFPPDITNAIYEVVGAVYFIDAAIIPCSMKYTKATLDIGFGGPSGPIMRIPLDELVLPLYYEGPDGKIDQSHSYNQATGRNGNPNEIACQLGVEFGTQVTLGDTILRSMYVVHDLANARVAIAQTKFNATDSNVVAFESLSAAIPSATSLADEVPVVTQNPLPNVPAATPTNTSPPDPVFSGPAGSALATAFSSAVGAKSNPGGSTSSAPTSTSTSDSKDNKGAAAGAVKPFAGEQMFLLALTAAFMAVGGLIFV